MQSIIASKYKFNLSVLYVGKICICLLDKFVLLTRKIYIELSVNFFRWLFCYTNLGIAVTN